MAEPPRRYWAELTTADFAHLDAGRLIAILPVAAVEQHGPHLPLATDAVINRGILERALALLPPTMPVVVLPAQEIGKSNEHQDFPGTLTLSAETLLRAWTEIAQSAHCAGVMKLVIFNSHGGQPQVADLVAQDLRARLGMLVVPVSWPALGLPDGLFPEAERRHGIHGGAIETALMLALAPGLVRRDAADRFASLSEAMAADYRRLNPLGATGFAWQTQDLNPAGAVGDATLATAEAGRRILDHVAASLVELLVEIDRFPIGHLRSRP